ncbi:hypothetical protein NGA_0698400, partial [Nannochloropsis gaditana CCMP526]|uniref:uncharacterized protein n=1 Tax=Nannochloropsis gaditana (strain CCMP526) TaxID=1093141 RepID=UPI00029F5F2C
MSRSQKRKCTRSNSLSYNNMSNPKKQAAATTTTGGTVTKAWKAAKAGKGGKQPVLPQKKEKQTQLAIGTGQQQLGYQALRKDLKMEIIACNKELHLLKQASRVRTDQQLAAECERAVLLRQRLHKAQEQLTSLATVPKLQSQEREKEHSETGGGNGKTCGEA